MRPVRIKVSHDHTRYDVVLGQKLDTTINETIKKLSPSSLIVVTDTNLITHARSCIRKLLAYKSGGKNLLCTIKAGERSKTTRTLNRLYDEALEVKPDRDTLVVALGGGVVGDIAGMLASTLLRGVRIMHLPTSLLAMVDSAVGGKTGINAKAGKNLIGTFHHPSAVIADLDMLKTLPDIEYRAALGEVVKYGVVLDTRLFGLLENKAEELLARDPQTLTKVVEACIRAKARVVSNDPTEEAGRIVLNFGHTLGHAIERCTAYRVRHGQAVALGIALESAIGVAAGITPEDAHLRTIEVLNKLSLKLVIPKLATLEAMMDAMSSDKKRAKGKLRFVLPTRIGEWTTWTPDNAAHLRKLLRKAIG